eukprot:1142781-Pelagomonas_calceolata.AAC.3
MMRKAAQKPPPSCWSKSFTKRKGHQSKKLDNGHWNDHQSKSLDTGLNCGLVFKMNVLTRKQDKEQEMNA